MGSFEVSFRRWLQAIKALWGVFFGKSPPVMMLPKSTSGVSLLGLTHKNYCRLFLGVITDLLSEVNMGKRVQNVTFEPFLLIQIAPQCLPRAKDVPDLVFQVIF